jgi:hypothetical protein
MCGEFFASAEDYQAKLLKEKDWAEAWFKWSEERKHESLKTRQEGSEKVGVEHEIEEISVEDELEQVAIAE